MKKKILALALVVSMALGLSGCGGGSKPKEISWPKTEIAGLLPKPESLVGEISFESADYLSIDIAKMSKEAFESYVDACKSKGFTEEYYGHEGFYSANNKDGYSLILNYDEKKKEMSITLSSPPAPTEENEDSGEIIMEEEDTSEDDTNSETESDDGKSSAGSDLREFIDSYEAFMDEYVEFMKKYKDNPTDLKLIGDYGKIMEKYTEFADKAANINEGDYTTEDYKYYLEVLSRCNQKMLEAM